MTFWSLPGPAAGQPRSVSPCGYEDCVQTPMIDAIIASGLSSQMEGGHATRGARECRVAFLFPDARVVMNSAMTRKLRCVSCQRVVHEAFLFRLPGNHKAVPSEPIGAVRQAPLGLHEAIRDTNKRGPSHTASNSSAWSLDPECRLFIVKASLCTWLAAVDFNNHVLRMYMHHPAITLKKWTGFCPFTSLCTLTPLDKLRRTAGMINAEITLKGHF
uniref:Uncharacterized protein n=1 Tax=Coccidioides posadasii RMSCC 3488 TaxID=454284 RepID=A0A0J6HZB3_COCPO|nr:hypothetical protein CPAG_00674 [Coccidioides posadasii RMSCC 3488]